MFRVLCHTTGSAIHRAQLLAQQTPAHTLMSRPKTLSVQLSHNPLSPTAAAALGVYGRNLHIQCRPRIAARTGRPASPLAVTCARNSQQSVHSCDRKLAAVRFHSGVPDRDPLAKCAAAFFNTSTFCFVSADSA